MGTCQQFTWAVRLSKNTHIPCLVKPYLGPIVYCQSSLGISQNPRPLSGTTQSQSANVSHSSENGTEKFSSMVEAIIDYTAHLYEARECHEAICKHKPEFTDFLTRCNSTAFSKRLDLWHFLGKPD
ncbi:hypothetical protein P879_08720 [Paragonimus westermani]|uniref:Uncharacterized protein n=1 Tax=Paragonimus westermani TaxID=34504 RepID=A0A8T0DDL0_9TREM|nr:hypothetical protein P879_08720 [Paragonimus westermani]